MNVPASIVLNTKRQADLKAGLLDSSWLAVLLSPAKRQRLNGSPFPCVYSLSRGFCFELGSNRGDGLGLASGNLPGPLQWLLFAATFLIIVGCLFLGRSWTPQWLFFAGGDVKPALI